LKRHEVQHYVNLLHTGKPFGLARYGDGEWRCILGEIGGKNSNGCTFTEEICDALRKVLHKNSSYEHAVLRIARDKLGKRIGNFLSLNGIKVEWTIGNTFLDESFKGKLWPLIAALRKRKIVYVGPEYLRPIKDIFFKYVAYVEIPPIDAYKEQGRIIPEMLHAVEQHEANLVGFSAGHHKHLFAEALWKHFNEQVSFIDFGCIWDGYLGKKSRKFLRKGQYDWKELQRLNVRRKL
jgi:hypothetical protein